MNANELADVLMSTKFQVDKDGTMIGVSHQAVNEAATMLRQQQAEIEQCKREIDELYESLKEAINDHKITHLHPFWIEYRKRKAQEK